MIGDPRNDSHTDESERSQLLRLSFVSPLEALFRENFEQGARVPRAMILIIGMLMIAVTPFYDSSVLRAPDSFLKLSHFLQFGLQIPSIVLALLFTLRPSLYRWSPAMTIMACMVTSCGVMAQHLVGREIGFDVPHDFAAITITAMLSLGRLRFWMVLPWAVLTLVITTWAQLYIFGASSFYDAMSSWMLASISGVTAYLLEYSSRQSWYRGRLLEFQACSDALTGLPNRRYFDLELRRLVREAIRRGRNVALLVIDIDHFKDYNDRHGHPTGDQCLRIVGDWLGQSMRRPHDFCARIGGEEFAAVWFDSQPDKAVEMAEALRAGIHALQIERRFEGGDYITASGGFTQVIAPTPVDRADQIAAELVERADSALYTAKRSGRSRLVIFGQEPMTGYDDIAEILP